VEPVEAELLRTLLTRERVLSLGVLVDDRPVVGVLPFLVLPDSGSLLVHASRLARHAKGLFPGAAFGAAIQAPDHPDQDPLRLPRFTFEGRVEALSEGDEAQAAREAWVGRFPSAAMTVDLGIRLLVPAHRKRASDRGLRPRPQHRHEPSARGARASLAELAGGGQRVAFTGRGPAAMTSRKV
jgi:hypothetical protein